MKKFLGFDVTTLYAFVGSLLSALCSLFAQDPHVVAVLQLVTKEFLFIGAALHLDGNPNFHLDADTIFAFAVSLITNLSTLAISDPRWTHILAEASQILNVVGLVFHLDGNLQTVPAATPAPTSSKAS